jgi:polyferredoxin
MLNNEEMREKITKTPKKVLGKSVVYILAGLGFVVGLAWNDAVQSLVKFMFPLETGGSLGTKFFYALIVTIVLVVVAERLDKYVEK